jgi:AcrR family transcriptional regulator
MLKRSQTVAKDPEGTRRRIITAALKVFLQKGYDGAAVNEIARKAGVTKGGLYHHFENKGHLFQEALRFIMSGMQEWSMEHFKTCKSSRSLLKKLLTSIGTMKDTFSGIVGDRGAKPRYTFLEILISAARRDPDVRREMGKIYKRTRDNIAKELSRGQVKGEIGQDVDVRSLAFEINALIEGAMLLSVLDDSVDLDREGRRIFANMWKGIST